jgi:hypothetical protein
VLRLPVTSSHRMWCRGRCTIAGCCAGAECGHPIVAAPPSKMMNSRRRIDCLSQGAEMRAAYQFPILVACRTREIVRRKAHTRQAAMGHGLSEGQTRHSENIGSEVVPRGNVKAQPPSSADPVAHTYQVYRLITVRLLVSCSSNGPAGRGCWEGPCRARRHVRAFQIRRSGCSFIHELPTGFAETLSS